MAAGVTQALPSNLSLIKTTPSRVSIPSKLSPSPSSFRFLALPVELRLEIYSNLLPPRNHTIVTDCRPTGYFYNSSFPSTGHSNYPFGRSPPTVRASTPYRVLNAGFLPNFPAPSIYPQILRVCKRVHEEAVQVLYGGKGVVFDFGVYSEALIAFMNKRSKVARACVREVKIAKEVNHVMSNEGGNTVFAGLDGKWLRLGDFMRNEMSGLRGLRLCLWSSSGSSANFPAVSSEVEGENFAEEWMGWEWTKALLELESLITTTITVWSISSTRCQTGDKIGFDTWLAARMVADNLVRDRMVKEGVVEERSVAVPGKAA